MKKLLMIGTAGLVGGFLCPTANAWVKSVIDTSGYTVLSGSDSSTQSSISTGVNFGGTPVGTKDYLVNANRQIRSPNTANANTTFAGRSLTLDEGAGFILKGGGSSVTVSDLRFYNAQILQGDGNSQKTIKGGLTIYGTPSGPSMFMGSGAGGTRKISVESTITGASGTRIQVVHNTETDDAGTAQFYTFLKGDNSGYAGSIEVVGAQNGVCLVGYNSNAFGASPDITLTTGGKLFGGGGNPVTLSGASITLDRGGLFGVYSKSGDNVGLSITGNSTISGTGTLTIHNSGMEGTHSRRVQFGSVAISGIDGIQVGHSILQLTTGYNNPTVPIVVTEALMLRTHAGIHAGPVTLLAGSDIDSAEGSIALASLTLEQTEAGKPFIRKFLDQGLITIDGNITNNLSEGEKIRIDFTALDAWQLAATNAYRVLSAANLGETGVTASDFVATGDNGDEAYRASITNGVFSIETDGNVKYLVYTRNKNVVYSTGEDGYNDNSLMAGTHWNDGKAPHDDADYFIKSGHKIRSIRGKDSTFNGNSLSVLAGGTFAVQGVGGSATVSDLRLYGGGNITTTTDWGNKLYGAITVYGSSTVPVHYATGWSTSSPEPSGRHLTIYAPISGSGSILCRYENGAFDVSHPAGLNLRGDNTGFTGQWQIVHPAALATFTSTANFGSASALVLNSNGVFRVQDGSFAISAPVVVNNTGSVSGSEELTNGGTFLVDTNQTLSVNGVVSGAGILRKTGAGTLLLNATNTISGNVIVKAGKIGGAGKVNTLELADGAGFDVSATQAMPFEIGALTVDGGITLHIHDAAGVDLSRIAVAKVGTLTGTLDSAKATVDGGRGISYKLSVVSGILYATKRGMTVSFR